MTIRERIEAALHGESAEDKRTAAIDGLIMAAYYMGKHDGARESGDAADARYRAQRRAARECRYYKMALAIVEEPGKEVAGGYKGIYTYHPDYSSDFIDTMGPDKWIGDDNLA